jgi:hypothetical protein
MKNLVLKFLVDESSEKFNELQSNEWKKQWVTNLVIENPIAYKSNDWKV